MNADRSSQEQMLKDFQQLLAERARLASRVTTKEEAAQRAKDRDVVRLASSLTSESIVKGLADLQLAFDRAIEELSSTLIAEASKLEQARRAIEVETGHLKELSNVEVAANALDILQQREQARLRELEEQSAQQREAFDQEVAGQREAWQREQEAREREMAEYAAVLHRERELAEADFSYDLERKQQAEMDRYEAEKRKKEQELVETEEQKQKQWAERERAISARAPELEAYQAQAAAFPDELAAATEQAREQAAQAAAEEAQLEADLFQKEIEANQRVRALKIQSLKATIARQAAQIEALSAELNEALRRAQDLASKAISSGAVADVPLPGRARSQEGD